MLDGVMVKDLRVHQDDRGSLFEAVHNYEVQKFGQVYVVTNPVRGAVRAFHCHERLVDYFILVAGVAKFAFVSDLEGAVKSGRRPAPGTTQLVVVSGERPKLITVPPRIYHGWMSISDQAILVSVGSELYDRSKPDEHRVPPHFFNHEFGGNPWTIEGR